MRHRRSSSFTANRKKLIAALLLLSFIALFLPGSWTRGLMSLLQVLAPLQDAATSAGNNIADAVSGDIEEISPARAQELYLENQALRNQLASASSQLSTLRDENQRLSAIRKRLGDQDSHGHGRLIPARVITGDMHSWRDSQLLRAGTRRGVSRQDPVVSQFFTVNQGSDEGLQDGLAVLMAEVLVGIVDEASTHTSRVRLISDPEVQMPVLLTQLADDAIPEMEFWLWGRGNGRMEVRDVPRDLVESGKIGIGSVVLSDDLGGILPSRLVIGAVAEVNADRRNPLLAVLTVEPPIDTQSLRRVYVYDPDPVNDGT